MTDGLAERPVFFRQDDTFTYNYFQGNNENNSRCYLAPERIVKEADLGQEASLLERQQMDVFELGCVIAEIYLGLPLFSFARLLAYKQAGDQDLSEFLNSFIDRNGRKLKAPTIELILSMINIDPAKRPDMLKITQNF